ncbi:MAG: GNAT family N-acetyltransferase [Alphaproteobacteria bacterium]|nr:GNAT family N-acetyltransferase [Alphaproteobacteria bacterium]
MDPAVGLVFHAHDGTDAASRAALDALLFEIFKLDLGPLDAMDGRDPSYRSFSYFDAGGRCVANASLCALPLVVQGRPVDALGVQSVAVRPELRGRGLFRDLMQRALVWCDVRTPLVLLTTLIPDLYEHFGFRVVPEHRIVGPAPAPEPGMQPARPLVLGADIALVKRLLDSRTPASDLVGLRHFGAMFLQNMAAAPDLRLDHLPGRDAIVASDTRIPGTFRLLDVVAREIPSLATILGALGQIPDRVEICFPTDKLGYVGEAQPAGKRTKLMARGDFVDGSEPFMLPETAAF